MSEHHHIGITAGGGYIGCPPGAWCALDRRIAEAFARAGGRSVNGRLSGDALAMGEAIAAYRRGHRAITGQDPDGSAADWRMEVEHTLRDAFEATNHPGNRRC